ncbi:MAG: radical SAM protein [Calditrichaeota bacterium]|nr:radical SAM protein [Calditrichota bacterium]
MDTQIYKRSAVFFFRFIHNWILKKVFSISLEITHSCNCNCTHCDKGGPIPDEKLASPEKFGQITRELNPLVTQISGGDPFFRKDLYQIVKNVKLNKYYPYMVLVTNGWLFSEEKYKTLKSMGVDEFSVSLDFPDERHDENRGISGLYQHLNNLIPEITRYGNRDITIISVIRNQTLPELIRLAEKANEWGASIVFSAYTPLRTNDFDEAPLQPDQLEFLHQQLNYIKNNRHNFRIYTSDSVLDGYYNFFTNGCHIPGCRAGYLSLVVNPDGKLVPCAMQSVSFDTREELIRQFSRTNDCGGCYVSLRANTERTLGKTVKEVISYFYQTKYKTSA